MDYSVTSLPGPLKTSQSPTPPVRNACEIGLDSVMVMEIVKIVIKTMMLIKLVNTDGYNDDVIEH